MKAGRAVSVKQIPTFLRMRHIKTSFFPFFLVYSPSEQAGVHDFPTLPTCIPFTYPHVSPSLLRPSFPAHLFSP